MENQPIIIKPPSLRRQQPGSTGHGSSVKSISDKRTMSRNGQKYLRNSNIRNPNTLADDISQNRSHDDFPESRSMNDEDFYTSLRKTGQNNTRGATASSNLEQNLEEYTSLKETAQGARETKRCLVEWKRKIQSLEENLRDQDYAMQDVIAENKTLEKEVQMLIRSQAVKKDIDKHTIQRNKLRRKEVQLGKALLVARKENDKLREELDSRNDKSEPYGGDSRRITALNLRRNDIQSERDLSSAERDKEGLLEEVVSCDAKFQQMEERNQKLEEEIKTLHSELEISRRIVHTKRSLLRKEMLDETRQQMHDEITERLTIELTEKIFKDLEDRMGKEKERELTKLRKIDDQKVRDVQHQVPVLEKEIDRLREKIHHAGQYHERTIAELEAHYEKKTETMIKNFSETRDKEELNFIKRVDELSTQNERMIARFEEEKEEYGSQVREEVKKEMQKEIQFLADQVTDLTKDSILLIEKAADEKELSEKSIREQLAKERDEMLAEAVKEKEAYAETIRDETIKEKDEEIKKMKEELENIVSERDSLLEQVEKNKVNEKLSGERQDELEKCNLRLEELEATKDSLLKAVDELEGKLGSADEKYTMSVKELSASKSALESSKNEVIKLKKNKRDLNAKIDEYKQVCEEMSNEVRKIKGHFKYAVLIEYEEKILDLEDEIRTLQGVVEESKISNSENEDIISNQSLLLEQYKAQQHAHDAEIKKNKIELNSAISEVESKDSRLAELKSVILKKEAEGSKMLQVVKDLRKSLNAQENEMIIMQNEKERLKQLDMSIRLYREKLTSVNRELALHKSRLEHCRCSGSSENRSGSFKKFEHDHYESVESPEHLRERIARLSTMLKMAEKNQHKEKINFEASKEQYSKDILACKNETEELRSEVSRLKNLLDQAQNDLRAVLEKGPGGMQLVDEMHRIQNDSIASSEVLTRKLATAKDDYNRTVKQMEERIQALSAERDTVLLKLETAEKTAYDTTNTHMQQKSEYVNRIQELEDELKTCNEDKTKVAMELKKSKSLFKEAIISWRVEARDLKGELDQLKESKDHDVSNFKDSMPNDVGADARSELKGENFILPRHTQSLRDESEQPDDNSNSSQIIEEDGDSKSLSLDDEHSPNIYPLFSVSEEGDSEMEMSHRSSSEIHDNIEESNSDFRDDESEQYKGDEERTPSRSFTKMLEISEHTTSIEMRFDNLDKRFKSDNESSAHKSLKLFKDEFSRYLEGINSPDTIDRSTVKSVIGVSRKFPESKISRAPQPHDDGDRDEDQNMRDPSMSLSMRNSASDADNRDDSVGTRTSKSVRDISNVQSSDSSFLQQGKIDIESRDSTSSDRGISDIRKLLQHQMMELREMSIQERKVAQIKSREVVTPHQQTEQEYNAKEIPNKLIPNTYQQQTTTFPRSSEVHPGVVGASSSPFDEVPERRDTLPFDEYSFKE